MKHAATEKRKPVSSLTVAIVSLPVGFVIGLGLLLVLEDTIENKTVNTIVCESFVGPQGPEGRAGADGKDGTNSTMTFTHVPALEGLFHEQNVQIEYHGGDE